MDAANTKKKGRKLATPRNHITLEDKLKSSAPKSGVKALVILSVSLAVGLLFASALDDLYLGTGAFISCAIFLAVLHIKSGNTKHFLIRFDQQGFMADLKLSDKTVIFDGSNIYHFGHANGVGRLPLGALVSALRSEGYRIVCFFDANIYFTLRKNGVFPKDEKRFSIGILQRTFELQADEIYVVPKGAQADGFIVESLSQLPISFAVTNDRYRDFKDRYDVLDESIKWRKGIEMKGGELMLYQHKFKYPLVLK